MNPLVIAGGVYGVLTLVDYYSPAAVVSRAKADVSGKCSARATAAAAPQDTLEQAQAVLSTLITLADMGRAGGAYSDAIDEDLATAKDQLAGATNTFFAPDLNDSRDAIAQLALAMDADCVINSGSGDFFTSQDSALQSASKVLLGDPATQDKALWEASSYVAHKVAQNFIDLLRALIPDWAWVAGVVVGAVYLVHSGVL